MSLEPERADYTAILKKAYRELRARNAELSALKATHTRPIAIIGCACRFPQSPDLDAYWTLLSRGRNAVRTVPRDRWDWQAFYSPDPDAPNKTYSRWGGFLDDIGDFDPAFFDISPREARVIDPQQRIFLEVAWEALESAGHAASASTDAGVGVFVGCSTNGYYQRIAPELTSGDHAAGVGNQNAIIANRVSFFLNLRGPSVVVDTMCSSSLVALHQACQSLRLGECAMAVAGGVNILLSPHYYVAMSRMKAHSPDGRCKPFDHRANGIVLGEGAGAVVLKPLDDAIRDGDRVHAVIRGSAVNHGGRTNGLTAPNPRAQAELISSALSAAGVHAGDVTYIEAHGTGTALGDPIEIQGLTKAFRRQTDARQFCAIGSVKSQIGHLEAAAGIASVIKVILAMKHGQIPPTLNLEKPNPFIAFEETPFTVNTTLRPWESQVERVAGVSSFGIGGTNAHVILEEAPRASARQALRASRETFTDRPVHLWTCSARDGRALEALLDRHHTHMGKQDANALPDICFSVNAGRAHFDERIAVVAEDVPDLRSRLDEIRGGRTSSAVCAGRAPAVDRPKIAFLFTGQGAQYLRMGQALYETSSVYRQAFDRCDASLQPHLGRSIRSVIGEAAPGAAPLDQTVFTQPAVFALEYALAQLWKSWGIEPDAVIGHSVGEYAAACVAGVFSVEDGAALVAHRGRLMQNLCEPGAMASVHADEARVRDVLRIEASDVAIAAVNGPRSVVLSGRRTAVEAAVERLWRTGIAVRMLNVSHACHSPLMAPMLAEFERHARAVAYAPPDIPLVSNVTGARVADDVSWPEYWCRHLTEPVRFYDGILALSALDRYLYVEIGPSPVLTAIAQECLDPATTLCVSSLDEDKGDWRSLLQSLGRLYVRGVRVDWPALDRDYSRSRVSLPTYPFQRQRCWLEPAVDERDTAPAPPLPLPGAVRSAAGIGFYDLQWQVGTRTPRQQPRIEPGGWLLLARGSASACALADRLRDAGQQCFTASVGNAFERLDGHRWRVNPRVPADLDRLMDEVRLAGDHPLRGIVYMWGMDAAVPAHATGDTLHDAAATGLAGLLHVVQTLIRRNDATTPRVWLVTRDAVPAGATAPSAIAQAPLWGFGTVVSLEQPQYWGGMVDLAPVSAAHADAAALVDATRLMEEITAASDGEDQVAFRGGDRLVQRLQRQDLQRQPLPLVPDATYLITGGLGALGLQVAQWMADRGARHFALVTKTPATAAAERARHMLAAAGAEARVFQADVTDVDQVARALAQMTAAMPPMRGVIHAAGVAGYSALQDISLEALERLLGPKVAGTWNLHTLTSGMDLDFFVCFSSLSSVLGSQQLAHYAAANRFLDVFAHHRRGLGRPALAINWGPWSGGGMIAEEVQQWYARMGMNALSPDDAPEALAYVLGSTATQVTVADIDWAVFRRLYEARVRRPLLTGIGAELSRPAVAPAAAPTAILLSLQRANRHERRALLTDYLRTYVARVLAQPAPDAVGVDRLLTQLGFDSLMTVELKNHCRLELGVDIAIDAILEGTSVAQLADMVLNELALASLSDTHASDEGAAADREELLL